jgi:hypothetical protein
MRALSSHVQTHHVAKVVLHEQSHASDSLLHALGQGALGVKDEGRVHRLQPSSSTRLSFQSYQCMRIHAHSMLNHSRHTDTL